MSALDLVVCTCSPSGYTTVKSADGAGGAHTHTRREHALWFVASMSVTIYPVLQREAVRCDRGRGRLQTPKCASASPRKKNCQCQACLCTVVGSVNVLGHPAEAVSVPHAADHTAHENLDGAHVGVHLDGALSGGVVCEAEAVAELVL